MIFYIILIIKSCNEQVFGGKFSIDSITMLPLGHKAMSSHMGEQLRAISPLDHLLITCIYLLNFGIFSLKIVIIQCMDFIPQSINYKE